MKPGTMTSCVVSTALIGAFTFTAVQADPQPGNPDYVQVQSGAGQYGGGPGGRGYGPGQHHGPGMHHGGKGGQHYPGMHHGGQWGHHGPGYHGGGPRAGRHGAGKRWMKILSPEQKQQVARLRSAHKKQAMPMKARMKAMKLELVALATADAPDGKAIEAKIDELLALKRQAMLERTTHMAEVRKLLTDEQKPAFDMAMMYKGKGGRRHHR